MKDRYLFRAKRIDNGEWIEGNLYPTGKWLNVFNNNAIYIGNEKLLREVDPSTICQCIGRKDRNEKLIFEMDIVKDESVQLLGTVKFSERHLQFVVDDIYDGEQDYSKFMKNVEVIGNIFDNLDLLGVESHNGVCGRLCR